VPLTWGDARTVPSNRRPQGRQSHAL
jgi:hypothetical protein